MNRVASAQQSVYPTLFPKGMAMERAFVKAGGTLIAGTDPTGSGGVVPGYDEEPVVQHMKGREVEIAIDLGLGRGKAAVWTCDLTHGYIDINASYRS